MFIPIARKGIARGICAVFLAGAMVASLPALALATGFSYGGYGGYGGYGDGWGGGTCYYNCGGWGWDGGCVYNCDGGGKHDGDGCTYGCDGGHTQVPEPGTVVLMGGGLLAVALWARRREQRV
jgi:hypothetical protein